MVDNPAEKRDQGFHKVRVGLIRKTLEGLY